MNFKRCRKKALRIVALHALIKRNVAFHPSHRVGKLNFIPRTGHRVSRMIRVLRCLVTARGLNKKKTGKPVSNFLFSAAITRE